MKKYVLQSALFWACIPIMWSFLPTYFDGIQMSSGQIGVLMAINPFVSIIAQPLFGTQTDKASSKNKVYNILMFLTVIGLLLIPMNTNYRYVILIIFIVSIFQAALLPISESITLESLEHIGQSYGPVRMAGTVSYALVAILVGVMMCIDITMIFYVTAVIGVANIVIVALLPTVKGHHDKHNKVSYKVIFEDRMLTIFISLTVIAQIMMSFFMTFFAVYFIAQGGSSSQVGWLFFIAALSEVPFLYFADRIIERFGVKKTLFFSMFIFGVRFVALVFSQSPTWFYFISLLHGMTYIIFAYSLAVYINKTVRRELRTTGQTVLAVASSIGKIFGSLLGGMLIDRLGFQHSMLIASMLCFTTLVAYNFILKKASKAYS
jgi:PPP family 3-phenylpropionic acid transporter